MLLITALGRQRQMALCEFEASLVYKVHKLLVKPSFLFGQKKEDDVGFPSVCCEYVLLPLVI